jgi:hypothetical protein
VNHSELNLGQADPIESSVLERAPTQQLRIYQEMRRQAIWAFNCCCVFACVGVVQGLLGIASVFSDPKVGAALLASAGLFGTLSAWGLKFSRGANIQLERVTSHEKARELIDTIVDPSKRDEEIGKFLRAILMQSKN